MTSLYRQLKPVLVEGSHLKVAALLADRLTGHDWRGRLAAVRLAAAVMARPKWQRLARTYAPRGLKVTDHFPIGGKPKAREGGIVRVP